MLVYAAVLLICLALLTVAHWGSIDQRKIIAILCVLLLTIFSSIRGYVGTDTYAYHEMFTNNSSENLADILKIVEPTFALLLKSVAMLSESSFAFVAIISIAQGVLLGKLTITSRNPLDFLILYIPIFYLGFHFNIIRAGTAILLLTLAMRTPAESNRQIKFFLFGIAAVMTHYSAIIAFVPMLVLRRNAVSIKSISIAIPIIILALLYQFSTTNELVLAKYLIYSDLFYPDVSNSVSLSFIFSVPLYLLLYTSVVSKKNWLELTLLFGVWIIVRWLTSVYSVMGRVEIIVNSMLLFSVVEFTLIGWKKQLRKISITGLALMWLTGSLYFLENESAVMDSVAIPAQSDQMSPYVPYRFFWDEK